MNDSFVHSPPHQHPAKKGNVIAKGRCSVYTYEPIVDKWRWNTNSTLFWIPKSSPFWAFRNWLRRTTIQFTMELASFHVVSPISCIFFCTRRRCILLAYSGTSYLTFDKAHDYTPLQLFAHPPGERKHNFIDNKGALKDLWGIRGENIRGILQKFSLPLKLINERDYNENVIIR